MSNVDAQERILGNKQNVSANVFFCHYIRCSELYCNQSVTDCIVFIAADDELLARLRSIRETNAYTKYIFTLLIIFFVRQLTNL